MTITLSPCHLVRYSRHHGHYLRPAIAGRHRSRRPLDLRFAAAAGSLAVEAVGLNGVPDRAAVNVRRARERIRRAVHPTLEPQVGDYREVDTAS